MKWLLPLVLAISLVAGADEQPTSSWEVDDRLVPIQVGPGMLFRGSPFRVVVDEAVGAIRAETDPTTGNYVQILDSGDDALLARIHLIRQATKSICVQTFIWTNDEVGRFVMYELIEAAKRGVQVRVIADHFVSDKDPNVVAFLATVHPNLQIKHYRPAADRIRPSKLRVMGDLVLGFRGFNQRMHNKILLVDDVAVIAGGRNIENTYYNRSTWINFRDREVLVIGPAVPEVRTSFNDFWTCRHVVPSRELLDVATVVAQGNFVRYITRADFAFAGLCDREDWGAADLPLIQRTFVDRLIRAQRVEFVADKPGKNRALSLRGGGQITQRLAKVIGEAQHEVIAQSPYFVLGTPSRKFFTALRKQKPSLRIVVSSNSFGSTDNVMAYSANYRLRSTYIESLGLETYEFKPLPGELRTVFPAYDDFARRAEERIAKGEQEEPPFLCIHAKSAVVDGKVAYIGSYNLDPRSANLNTEIGFLIEDRTIARQLRDTILGDCQPENSWVIAKRQMPLSSDKLNGLVEGLMHLSPVDLWPIRNTSSFELLPGRSPVPTNHPDFYRNYQDIGSFPGAPAGLSAKEITTRLYKALGPLAVSVL